MKYIYFILLFTVWSVTKAATFGLAVKKYIKVNEEKLFVYKIEILLK